MTAIENSTRRTIAGVERQDPRNLDHVNVSANGSRAVGAADRLGNHNGGIMFHETPVARFCCNLQPFLSFNIPSWTWLK